METMPTPTSAATLSMFASGSSVPSDLSMLASSSLPAVGDNAMSSSTTNPSWTRSLQELKVANTALLGSAVTGQRGTSSSSSIAAEESRAYSRLTGHGPRGMDLTRLSRMSRSLEIASSATSATASRANNRAAAGAAAAAAESSSLGVDEFLRQHQQGIFERILQKERLATRRISHQHVQRRMKEDWAAERSRYFVELAGHRTLGGASAAISGNSNSNTNGSTMNGTLTTTAPPLNSRSTTPGAASTPFGAKRANAFASNHLAPTPSVSTLPALDTKVVQSHVSLVAQINQHRTPVTSLEAFDAFQRLNGDGDSVGGATAQQSAYGTAWKLLQSMSCRRPRALPVEVAMGALSHFCRQFHSHVTSRVRTASQAGQDISTSLSMQGSNGMVGMVAAYVKLELGATNSPWPIVYYSLRCGDAVAAKNALEAAAPAVHDDNMGPVHNVLSQLVQVQGSASCLWDSMSAPVISAQDRQPLVSEYHRANNRDPVDPFMSASLALLSLAEPISSSNNLVNTIEDYLFGALWNTVQMTHPIEDLAKLGEDIKHWGPKHFADTEGSGGWAYTLPLLAAQQYTTALSYLADAGGTMGLLHSTHLSLVLALAGTEFTDLSPPNSASSGTANTTCLLTALLVSYSMQLQATDAAASLEYLVRIPDPGRVRKEISRLIVETKDYDLLGGKLSVAGSRDRNGALDNHFSPDKVASLLADAAGEADKRKNTGDAAQLLLLAGHYDSLLSLLNRQLASQLGDTPNADRMFWQQSAQRFHAVHLTNGRTHVTEVLETQGKIGLVDTFNLLIELTTFVERLTAKEYEEAWSVVDRLNLLPNYDGAMTSKVQQFNSLDAVLKGTFSVVLLGSMECLYQQHARLKSSMHGAVTASVQQRLQELRSRARLLVTFAGLIQLEKSGGATNTRMVQMEAHMM